MDLRLVPLKACHRAMLNIYSQSVDNDTGRRWGATGKSDTPCHVQRDRAPSQIIIFSQLSILLTALFFLCAFE